MENSMAALSETLVKAVERAAPSTVAVRARGRLGSTGIVWSRGVIVTAEHTVSREEDIPVTFGDGKTVKAELAGRDPGSDIAVLRYEDGFAPEPLPRAGAVPRAGSLVLSVGRATDGNTAATFGIVSVSGGPWTTWRGGKLDALLRLDVRLYPTCSGSALIDVDGKLAGLATAGLTRTLPAAVPVATLDRVVRELIEMGQVRRGYLGVGVQRVVLPQHLGSQKGLIVITTEAGGPAEKAGILIGDILVRMNSGKLEEPTDLHAALSGIAPGTAVDMHILRGGTPVTVRVTVGDRPRS
jgi:S1-C subfamily serine protease